MSKEDDRKSAEASPKPPILLGPFLGQVTQTSIKIWLHLEGATDVVYVTIHEAAKPDQIVARGQLRLEEQGQYTDCITVGDLKPDTKYIYRLWENPQPSIPLSLQGLNRRYLQFMTLPSNPEARVDFVLMSCHNPFKTKDDFGGHAVWVDLLQIIGKDNNEYVRFAVLGGDQMYSDDYETELLAEKNDAKRLSIYLNAYRKYWSNIHYRRVMAGLPAVMIWDDHEIMDGWGSEIKSFVEGTDQFKPNWLGLLRSASAAFAVMQASRNPDLLSNDAFDCCFKLGQLGFVLLDLRTNRNFHKQRIMSEDQFKRISAWLDQNRGDMRVLFVVSPVVFSHGPPIVERLAMMHWRLVLAFFDGISRLIPWARGMHQWFYKNVGDVRDDIRDAWSSDNNAAEADRMLDKLFGIQNDEKHPVPVVILSGDIHTSGFAMLYSSEPAHSERPSIPHVTSSSVSYEPFHWFLEAVYRHAAKTVPLGKKRSYSAQVSHHFSARTACVLSIRPYGQRESLLKVKYYLEAYPEPQILLFDLSKGSHRENIQWVAAEKFTLREFSPPIEFDVERFLEENDVSTLLEERAAASKEPLNYTESIVDLMKLLDLDSSLGARKLLAQRLGYPGVANGSAEMNNWLHQRVMEKYIQARGTVPEVYQSRKTNERELGCREC